MSSAFESIKQGIDEALEFSKGKKGKAIVHEFSPVDVKKYSSPGWYVSK